MYTRRRFRIHTATHTHKHTPNTHHDHQQHGDRERQGETSRSHGIDEKGFHEKLCASDRSRQPEITPSVIEARNLSENTRVEQTHDRSGQPDKCSDAIHHEIKILDTDNEFLRERIEEDIDFNIPGLPHSMVKQLQSANVRELIQKIENHPNRHALQRDLQQSQPFNPFSQELKTNDS